MKSWRQSQILDVIDREPISSQERLRRKLQDQGISATQATLSRDLKELGLVKRAGDGAYTRPGDERGSQVVGEYLARSVNNCASSCRPMHSRSAVCAPSVTASA